MYGDKYGHVNLLHFLTVLNSTILDSTKLKLRFSFLVAPLQKEQRYHAYGTCKRIKNLDIHY